MKFTGSEIATMTGGTLLTEGPSGSVGTDTRTLQAGSWFLALVGDHFDGHAFLGRARDSGCAGVIGVTDPPADWDRGWVRVMDPLRALQDLAAGTRERFEGPVVGITGSVGKTTTRSLVTLALGASGPVHQTQGNLNNHIGLPLSILAWEPQPSMTFPETWVLELGMSDFGEIRRLQEISAPTVRVITNVGPAHLERLGDLAGVARAKGELFAGARAGDLLIVNMDDPRVAAIPHPPGVWAISYGSSQHCDVRLLDASLDPATLHTRYVVSVGGEVLEGALPVPGLHMAHDACVAFAVAHGLGRPLAPARDALMVYEPVGMRMRVEQTPSGSRILNDAYNANPASVIAGLHTLAALPGRRVALLGDMLELGPGELLLHEEVLEEAISLDLALIGVCGPRMSAAAARIPEDACLVVASDALDLATKVRDLLEPGDCILVKGSRGMRMEQILPMLHGQVGGIH